MNYIKGYLQYWTVRTRAFAELPKEDMKGQGRIGDPFPVKTSLGYNLGLSLFILLFLLPFHWAEGWHASTPRAVIHQEPRGCQPFPSPRTCRAEVTNREAMGTMLPDT